MSAYDDYDPVHRAKGFLSANLYLLDHATGVFDMVPLDTVKFRTHGDGFVIFDSEFDTDLFADGFESGDTSAWVHTRTAFTSKKADWSIAGCEITG